jgi:hypothetical protein
LRGGGARVDGGSGIVITPGIKIINLDPLRGTATIICGARKVDSTGAGCQWRVCGSQLSLVQPVDVTREIWNCLDWTT